MKILVIDDVKFSCIYMKRIFEQAGHTVLTSYEAVDGLQILKENPDITMVFTDLVMPEMDGVEFLLEAQKLSVFNSGLGGMALPPFVLLTASNDQKRLEEATYSGFRQVVQKPVDGQQLLNILDSITQIAADQKSLNLMIVDSSGSTHQWMTTMFDGTQHTLHCVDSAEEALKQVEEGKISPSVVISENSLDSMSGIDLFQGLKRLNQQAIAQEKISKAIPFLLLTDDIEPRDLKRCRDIGLKDIMHKPLDLAMVAAKISKMVSPESHKKKKQVKPEVLVVDDVGYNLVITQKALEQSGYQVHAVKSSFEALTILENNPSIELVVADLMMPEMEGIELIKAAKKKMKNRPPFILLTASTDEGRIHDAHKSGYAEVVRKPASIDLIASAVEKVLSPPEPKSEIQEGDLTPLVPDESQPTDSESEVVAS